MGGEEQETHKVTSCRDHDVVLCHSPFFTSRTGPVDAADILRQSPSKSLVALERAVARRRRFRRCLGQLIL